MKKAFVFPGQGAQYPGMGKELWEQSETAKQLFDQAEHVLGFDIRSVMFNGTADDLKETRVTQPAIFLQSVVAAQVAGDQFQPDAVAGHSLGEFSALTAVGALDFTAGLTLVRERALAMQEACESVPGTMAAIVGLPDHVVEEICSKIDGVVPANYNSPGQLVISGEVSAVEEAVEACTAAGAKRALLLPVGGAFHSPLMAPARERLARTIEATNLHAPRCPVYQNVDASPTTDPTQIKSNLVAQLTAPVRWTQSVQNMYADGHETFIEVGGKGVVLRGLIRRIEPKAQSQAL